MVRASFARFIMALMLFPAFSNICQGEVDFTLTKNQAFNFPSGDTIFVYDTIYQIHIVYDTIFYSDSLSQLEIISPDDTLAIKQDSTSFEGKRFVMPGYSNNLDSAGNYPKTSYTSHLDFNKINKAGEPLETSRTEEPVDTRNTKPAKHIQNDESLKAGIKMPFFFIFKDTLYRADTIVVIENLNDTSYYFKLSARSDTSVFYQTIIENRQNIVVVNKLVNIVIQNKSYVITENSVKNGNYHYLIPVKNFLQKYEPTSQKANKKGTKNHFRKNTYKTSGTWSSHRDLENSSRVSADNIKINYETSIEGGAFVFFPEISFTSKNESSAASIDLLNKNTSEQPSYGGSAGIRYFRNNFGIETGLGFSNERFELDHQYSIAKVDSSYYWDYFNRQDYEYDTTWYLDLDEFLTTGNTVFIPSVDSSLIWVTDSTYKTRYDTTTMIVPEKYNYSFSYLEIPLIARYRFINQDFFGDVAAGLMPSLLISKKGYILSPETDEISKTQDLNFDYNFSLSMYAAITLGYKIDEKWAICAEPFIKKTIFSGIENDKFSMKTNSWGLKFMILFRL